MKNCTFVPGEVDENDEDNVDYRCIVYNEVRYYLADRFCNYNYNDERFEKCSVTVLSKLENIVQQFTGKNIDIKNILIKEFDVDEEMARAIFFNNFMFNR